MKIYLTDQIHNLKKHLDFLRNSPVMSYDKTQLIEKVTTIDIRTYKQLNQIDFTFLFNYNIFPSNIMAFKTEWKDENREMKVGDTIVQQAYIPPIKYFSQKLIFGVRISAIINQAEKKGFSYETIEGHVEKGISTFTVEQINNKLIFKIQTFSTPGNLLTKLLGSFFSIPYQTFCTKQALKNVKRQIEGQNR